MEKGGVWLRRWVVLLGLYLATAEDKGVELGPRLPGDPKYWLRLKGISFSEGHLEPAFDGKLHDFQLKVANPAVRSFTMTIRLELQHYDLLALPKILVNGKALEYSPLNAIVVPVFMNDTISKEDKVVTITLEDPSGKKFGGFLGIGGKARSHDYNIRCLQPPEFQKVVTINSLEVKLQNGKPMTPDKTDNTTGQYWYTLPASATGAYLKALCGKYSTSMTVNGVTVNSGSDFWIEMMVPHVTWLVECRYEDARWAQAAVGRTYQVHMNHLQDNFEPPTVRLMPQNGLCQEDEDVEGGVYCRCAHRSNLQLITTFQETSVEVFLKTGLHEQNLLSGIPTMVSLPSSNTHWKLLVKGMKTVEVPLRMVVAERCHGLTCPNGWVPRPALNGGEDAAIHLCYSEHCNMEDDGSTCCREAGTPCEEYSWDCGEGLEFFERGFCKGTPCEQTLDRKYCCIPKYDDEDAVQKGEQFNMKKGQWWKWFKKTDQHAETVVEELGDRVEFLTTLELKNKSAAPCFSKALESLVKEKFGVKKNAVKVSHFSGPPKDVPGAPKHEMENSDDMETFEVQVLNFEGPEKEQQLLDMVKGFIEGNGGASLTQALEEKKQCGSQKLQAKFTSKVEGVRAPRPTIDVKMVMEISKSADLGKGGGGEELAPEVQAALREAILSLAEIPDKEHIKLNFKKITSGEGIPEDDELVAIKGRIELPPGKEGSKQILASKLRNPSRVGRKMNKVLLKDVEKAEEDPNSRIIGGKKDYKVSSVDVVGVSGSPKDLGFKETASPEKILRAWLGLTTTTTTTVNVDGAALLRAANGQCIQAPRSRELGLRPIIEKCNHNDGHQAWFYTHSKHTLQSFMGLCLAADLNGPHPIPGVQDYRSDTHPGILQSWIQQGGPTQAHLWACNAHWQQAFIYNQKTGQMKIAGSSNPGMCLQTQGKSLVVALCKNTAHGAAFMQQFWLEKSRAEPFLPTHVSSALDLPIFVKPYFDGKVALKSSDSTYDTFKIAPFSQKRAAFYLTQGCSPVPTASCGTPVPDMPNVYVGQSLVKVSQKVDKLPWMSAFRGPQKNSGLTMCVYDPECKRADSRADRIQQFLHGCNAGGKPMCRYCGGNNPGQYGECPKWFDCANGGLEAGTWSKEHRQWCCEKFSEGCDAPYNCVEDLAKWRDWEGPKKMWCCAYQMVACEDECKKKNPALFRENHDYWCSTFGKEESEAQPAKSGPSPFELMVMQMFDKTIPRQEGSSRATVAFVTITLLSLTAMALTVWRRRARPPPTEEVEPLVD